jgi:AcrR family transcriptional regulator
MDPLVRSSRSTRPLEHHAGTLYGSPLKQKPDTKRPAIVAAATSLFARKGIDATSMRDVAEAAGVREAAIYRHFRGKDEMAREIFASWYGWYTRQVRKVGEEEGPMRNKLRALVHVEFETARTHPQEFLYFCDNEARFLPEPRYPSGSAGTRQAAANGSGNGRCAFGRSGIAGRHAERRALWRSNLGDKPKGFADFGKRGIGSRELLANAWG